MAAGGVAGFVLQIIQFIEFISFVEGFVGGVRVLAVGETEDEAFEGADADVEVVGIDGSLRWGIGLLGSGLGGAFAQIEKGFEGVVELALEHPLVAHEELEGLAVFGEVFEGIGGRLFGVLKLVHGFGLDFDGMGADAGEAKLGVSHFADVAELGWGLWAMFGEEGVEELLEGLLVFGWQEDDGGKEAMRACVLGRALFSLV